MLEEGLDGERLLVGGATTSCTLVNLPCVMSTVEYCC